MVSGTSSRQMNMDSISVRIASKQSMFTDLSLSGPCQISNVLKLFHRFLMVFVVPVPG